MKKILSIAVCAFFAFSSLTGALTLEEFKKLGGKKREATQKKYIRELPAEDIQSLVKENVKEFVFEQFNPLLALEWYDEVDHMIDSIVKNEDAKQMVEDELARDGRYEDLYLYWQNRLPGPDIDGLGAALNDIALAQG